MLSRADPEDEGATSSYGSCHRDRANHSPNPLPAFTFRNQRKTTFIGFITHWLSTNMWYVAFNSYNNLSYCYYLHLRDKTSEPETFNIFPRPYSQYMPQLTQEVSFWDCVPTPLCLPITYHLCDVGIWLLLLSGGHHICHGFLSLVWVMRGGETVNFSNIKPAYKGRCYVKLAEEDGKGNIGVNNRCIPINV